MSVLAPSSTYTDETHVIVFSHTLIEALFGLVPPLCMRMRCGEAAANPQPWSASGRSLLQSFPINPVRPNIPPPPNKFTPAMMS